MNSQPSEGEKVPATEGPKRAARNAGAFGGGALIGALGGLIGLGGAEFRLPLLIGAFNFAALEAVILNKAMSLVVVASALPFRARTVPFEAVADHWAIVVNLLAGSLAGAWFGAGWATRLKSQTLYRVIAIILVAMAAILLFAHDPGGGGQAIAHGVLQVGLGIAAGFVIGVVASLLGVAGGELLIPTLVLLFGLRPEIGGQPFSRREPADHGGRFHALQPRQQLCRSRPESLLRSDHGCGLGSRNLDRWAAPGDHFKRRSIARTRSDPAPLGSQGLAAPLTRLIPAC